MNLIRIDHVSLNAADRPRTIAWYAEVLGLRTGDGARRPDQPVFLGPDGAQFGLFADRAPGLRHVALATDAASQARVVARLDRLAIPYHAERRSIYVADPDGSTVEVLVA
jgi:catechol 2,3-dioxygenase-like lactoylglutathione lyase family enzyme